MPSECIENGLQRELADCITKLANLDDLRILLATGARVNESVTQVSDIFQKFRLKYTGVNNR